MSSPLPPPPHPPTAPPCCLLLAAAAEASERACEWALRHLYRQGDFVHLLRVIPALPYRAAYALDGMVAYYFEAPGQAAASEGAARRWVEHRFEPLLRGGGVPYSVDVLVEGGVDDSVEGVGEAICRKASDLEAVAVSAAGAAAVAAASSGRCCRMQLHSVPQSLVTPAN